MKKILGGYLTGLSALDLRSLAVMRMSIGLTLCLDILLRSRDITAHYTDDGVLPRVDLLNLAADPWWLSLHLVGGGRPFQAFLFGLAGLAGFALFLGYQTRLATLISWVLLVSIQSRNPMLLNSGDVLLRVVLFWCIFLPWGARWSVDGQRTVCTAQEDRSVAAFAYAVQIALLYGFAASSKSGLPWLDGSAIYYALSIDQFQTVLGGYMLQFPSLLKYLTWGVVGFQWAVPILLFFPVVTRHTRLLAVVGLAAMHVGIGLCMHIGLFSLIAVAVSLGLLPGYLWEHILPANLKQRGGRLLALFDRRLPKRSTPPRHFVLQSKVSQGLLGGLLIYVVMWNFGRVPLNATWLGQLFRLDQQWSMFAPYPLTDDGWYTIEGELGNGRRIDLFRRTGDLSFDKPERVAWSYPNQRWRKYIMNLYAVENREHRELFLRYLAQLWNKEQRAEWRVEKARLYYTLERTLPQGTEPPRRLLLMEYKVQKEEKRGQGLRQLFGVDS